MLHCGLSASRFPGEGTIVARSVAVIVVLLTGIIVALSGCNDTGELPEPGGTVVGLWYAQRAVGPDIAAGVSGPVLPLKDAMCIWDSSSLLVTEMFRFENASNMHYRESLGDQRLFWWDAEYRVLDREPVVTTELDSSAEQGTIVFTRIGQAGGTESTTEDSGGAGALEYVHLRVKRNSAWQDFLDLKFQLSDVTPLSRTRDPRFEDREITLTLTREPLLEDPLPPPGLQ
jgi:hypothetical protein